MTGTTVFSSQNLNFIWICHNRLYNHSSIFERLFEAEDLSIVIVLIWRNGLIYLVIIVTIFLFIAVLILEFRTFKSTIIVLSVLPLGVVGAVLALLLTGNSLSFVAIIGLIALAGIEVKNTGVLAGNGFTLRYAGQGCRRGSQCAGILVNSGRVELQNALIEKNREAGVRLNASIGSYFTNVSFIGHQEPLAMATGLVLINSDIGADTLHFADNAIGVSVTNSTVAVADPSSITYSGNLIDAAPTPWF